MLGVSKIDWTMLSEKRLVKRGKRQPFLSKRNKQVNIHEGIRKEWIAVIIFSFVWFDFNYNVHFDDKAYYEVNPSTDYYPTNPNILCHI